MSDEENKVVEPVECGVEFFLVEVNFKIENKTVKKQYSIIAPNESFIKENVLAYLGGEVVKVEKVPCFILQTG